jgi:hypothetical protein
LVDSKRGDSVAPRIPARAARGEGVDVALLDLFPNCKVIA